MTKDELKIALIENATDAFLDLSIQLVYLLNAVDSYIKNPEDLTKAGLLKKDQLDIGTAAIGELCLRLGDVVTIWKSGKMPMLSMIGIEVEILNELFSTVDAVDSFLKREKIESRFDKDVLFQSYKTIQRVNRALN